VASKQDECPFRLCHLQQIILLQINSVNLQELLPSEMIRYGYSRDWWMTLTILILARVTRYMRL
jgi:hypothetical protein